MTFGCPNRLNVNCAACEIQRAAGAVPTWCKREDAAITRVAQAWQIRVLCGTAAAAQELR